MYAPLCSLRASDDLASAVTQHYYCGNAMADTLWTNASVTHHITCWLHLILCQWGKDKYFDVGHAAGTRLIGSSCCWPGTLKTHTCHRCRSRKEESAGLVFMQLSRRTITRLPVTTADKVVVWCVCKSLANCSKLKQILNYGEICFLSCYTINIGSLSGKLYCSGFREI